MQLFYPEFIYDIADQDEADFYLSTFGSIERAREIWLDTLNNDDDVQQFIDTVSGTDLVGLFETTTVCVYNSTVVPWGGEGECMSVVFDKTGTPYIFIDVVMLSELQKHIPEEAYYISYDNTIYYQFAKEGKLTSTEDAVIWDGKPYTDEDINVLIETVLGDPTLPEEVKHSGDLMATVGSLCLPWELLKCLMLHNAGLVEDLSDDVIEWLKKYYVEHYGELNLPAPIGSMVEKANQ